METDILTATDSVQLNARAAIAGAMAQAFTDPRRRRSRLTGEQGTLLRAAWELIATIESDGTGKDVALGDLPIAKADIEPVIQWLTTPPAAAEDAYVTVYGLTMPRNCPPYETEYLHWTDATYRSQQMADIAAFYRAFGLDIGASRHDRHDHVALEIEFVAFLLRKLALYMESDKREDSTHEQVCVAALESFLHDHLLWWAPTFARSLEGEADKAAQARTDDSRLVIGAMAGTTRALRAWLTAERRWAGVEPSGRIIAPMVEPPHADDEGELCGECDHQACAPSVFAANA